MGEISQTLSEHQDSVRLNMAGFVAKLLFLMKSFPFLLLGLVIGCTTMFSTFAKDREGKSDDLDPAIAAMLKERYPGYRITDVDHRKKGGEKVQQVRLNGKRKIDDVLVTLSRRGEILELDEDMELEKVPDYIVAAFRKAFPDTEVMHSEKTTRMEILYQFDIEKDGKKHEVSVSRSGRISGVARRD